MLDKNKIITEEIEVGGKKVVLEIGRYAPQATAAVVAKCEGTVVLATVVMGDVRTDIDYFPLSVEYVERLYAGGRIKGSRWVKREGRPSDDAVLSGRMIDRSIRPLFPKGFKNDVQVAVTVLSVDGENHPDVLGGVATSAALAISPIPWAGPVGMVRVGEREGEWVINPANGELAESALDLIVSSTKDKVLMLEAGAKQIADEKLVEATGRGHEEAQKVVAAIAKLAEQVGESKIEVPGVESSAEVKQAVEKLVKEQIEESAKEKGEKVGDRFDKRQVLDEAKEKVGEKAGELELRGLIDKLWKVELRKWMLKNSKRVDGRGWNDIREISGDVALLPRTHGSGLFRRGMTHVLSVATLGTPSLEQWIETAEGEEQKRYIHHYSMPPYSVGETGRMGSPKRREIGHGALAEKALASVIPDEGEFPYTIRVVSEVMSSNGSTSMGSTCASTMALMDAGVPIKAPISGVAMGLVEEGNEAIVLTDIAGIEDFNGDMDFKVAGSKDGVTAVQLDVKNHGLSLELVKEVFEKAKTGRLAILEKMLKVIGEPRKEMSPFAPVVEVVEIPTEKIGEVIGPGGKTIRKIIAETGAEVDVEDDGKVTVSGIGQEAISRAVEWVKNLVREVEPGEIFEGEVTRIEPYGAFVSILPGKEGLVHVSRMTGEYVADAHDVVTMGQKVQVRVSDIDPMGKIALSMILDPELEKELGEKKNNQRGGREQRGRGPSSRSGRGGYSGGGGRSQYSGKFPQVRGERYSGRDTRGGRGGSGTSRYPTSSGDFNPHRRPGRGMRSAPSGRRQGR